MRCDRWSRRDGWRPSQAAERDRHARPRPGSRGEPGAADRRAVASDRPDGRQPARPPTSPIDAFVAAAGRLDIDGMERILDEAFAAQRFELAMDAVVFPALRAVGGVG